jgi:LmbE family N-acetylglucosaminyl deacetylase
MRRPLLIALLILLPLGALQVCAQFPPAPGTGPGLPDTVEAIENARNTTRILYITAHPDDESGAVLTYLARGLHADVALLSLTRGEGGQNALGPEQAPQLGLIRTQELLAATRGYGVKLYFTRARDFGYSKTPEETEKIWGDAVLEDMVRVIREFRPNIVVNNWGGVHSGHGHHQASGIWTPKAVQMAGDANAFPELLKENLRAWKGGAEGVQILDIDRGGGSQNGVLLPLDDVAPLWGKTWREIGIDAFANHRTQGITAFLNSPFIRRPMALIPESGKPFDAALLSMNLSILAGRKEPCACAEELREIDRQLDAAKKSALELDWPRAAGALVAAEQALDKAAARPAGAEEVQRQEFLNWERNKLGRALTLAAGVELIADSDRTDVPLGDEFSVTLQAHCRQKMDCHFDKAELHSEYTVVSAKKAEEKSGAGKWTAVLGGTSKAPIVDQLLGQTPPAVYVDQDIKIGDYTYTRGVPVYNTETTSTTVARVPLRIVPAYTISVDPNQFVRPLATPAEPLEVFLRIHSYSNKAATTTVGMIAPDGFSASKPMDLSFTGIGDQYAKFRITPPSKPASGNFVFEAYVKRGDEKFSTSLSPLPSMPTILWSEPAQTVAHVFDIKVPGNLRVGYISAEGEPIPEALRRLGISVELLDANALNFGNLSKFTSIVVGVRAYELRPELASANRRLLEYVSDGGTLVVQYNRDFAWDRLSPAPYRASIGSPTPRITDENAAVKFLKPDDPLLNSPNRITQEDFQGWIQERGLYFWSDFDSKYTALLAMHDPGEQDLNGGLVYAKYGKGIYIYTGLAFFREIPEGIPGAYRLFVNLLSAAGSR